MRLSFAHIATYLQCPKRYAYRYREGLTEPLSWQASFGTSIHNALCRFTREVQGDQLWTSLEEGRGATKQVSLFEDGPRPLPPGERLHALLDASWVSVGYPDAQAMYSAKAEALSLLDRWYIHHGEELRSTVATELSFRRPVGDGEVHGRIDRIDRREGHLVVVDYKSGRRRSQEDVESDMQLGLYALVLHDTLGLDTVHLGLYFLRDDVFVETRRDAAQCAQTRQIIQGVHAGVTAEEFAPTPSPRTCSSCPFRTLCPNSQCTSPSDE